jgi:putative DNA primase/helicase
MIASLRGIARALDGVVTGGQVLCPGPGHGPGDRSLSVRLSATSPDGFIAFSHSADDWRACRDYVRERLGIAPDAWKRARTPTLKPAPQNKAVAEPDDADRSIAALKVWREGVDPRDTLAERYLASRKLDLGDDIAGDVLRWHPQTGAMLALFRNIYTDEPQAVSRTFLDPSGRKLERKFLGPVAGAAVKLDPDANVLAGLHIGEGVETCLAARQLGLRPAWARGSCGAIAGFAVLGGVECLTIFAEHDDASEKAVETCAARWHSAGREVLIDRPLVPGAKDLNDAIRGAA